MDDDGGLFAYPCSCDVVVNVFGGFFVGHAVSEDEGFYHERVRVDG